MTGQRTTHLNRVFTGVIALLLVLGFGVGGLAAWSGDRKPLADRGSVF
jgi:hypothetical protein